MGRIKAYLDCLVALPIHVKMLPNHSINLPNILLQGFRLQEHPDCTPYSSVIFTSQLCQILIPQYPSNRLRLLVRQNHPIISEYELVCSCPTEKNSRSPKEAELGHCPILLNSTLKPFFTCVFSQSM